MEAKRRRLRHGGGALMSRAVRPKVHTDGLYARLAEAEEEQCREWETNVSSTHAPGAPYPRQRILDDLRARRTVNVPRVDLPRAAQNAARGRTSRMGETTTLPARAIITPTDRVTFLDDNWAELWLEENGLLGRLL